MCNVTVYVAETARKSITSTRSEQGRQQCLN
jgi:hypothetical protein